MLCVRDGRRGVYGGAFSFSGGKATGVVGGGVGADFVRIQAAVDAAGDRDAIEMRAMVWWHSRELRTRSTLSLFGVHRIRLFLNR